MTAGPQAVHKVKGNLLMSDVHLNLADAMERLISIIDGSDSFVITTHVFPDGDAIGSELALCRHLRAAGKNAFVVNSSPTPAKYSFLDREGIIQCLEAAPWEGDFDVAIVVDNSFLKRTGAAAPIVSQPGRILVTLDHHAVRDDSFAGALAVLDTSACSCGEIILRLIKAMGGTITPSIAECLYTSILTDTGRFSTIGQKPGVFGMAAELVARGADPQAIYREIYESYRIGHYRLFARALEGIRIASEGQAAILPVSEEFFKEYDVPHWDIEFFIDLVCTISGFRLIAVAKEVTKGNFSISLRSRCDVSVGKIAERFGGGGHMDMAGMIMRGELSGIVEQLSKTFEEALGPDSPYRV